MKRIETRQPVCEEFGTNINKAGTGFELGNGIHFIMEINKNLKRFVFFSATILMKGGEKSMIN